MRGHFYLMVEKFRRGRGGETPFPPRPRIKNATWGGAESDVSVGRKRPPSPLFLKTDSSAPEIFLVKKIISQTPVNILAKASLHLKKQLSNQKLEDFK